MKTSETGMHRGGTDVEHYQINVVYQYDLLKLKLVLSRQVSVPQRWFTPQEKALDERILLNPVTSYSDKNYADDVAKTTDDAPAARSSCVPVLQ